MARYPIFGHGIASLLRQATNYKVVCENFEPDQLASQLEMHKPDVIILDQRNNTDPIILAVITHSLPFSNTTVIGLSPEDNSLSLISARQMPLSNLNDLIAVID
jgi:DNA-binding NarL/FixJ family response regulator